MKTVTGLEVTPIAELVDRLGVLRATIAPLMTELEDVEGKLKAAGKGTYAGILYNATVSEYDRDIIQWKAIAYKVGFTHQLKAAHTGSVPVTAIRVTGRKIGS